MGRVKKMDHSPPDITRPRRKLLWVKANEEFHDTVVRAAHNERLQAEIVRTRLYSFNNRIVSAYDPELLSRSWSEHEQIAQAIMEGDGDRAAELARGHVDHSVAIIFDRS